MSGLEQFYYETFLLSENYPRFEKLTDEQKRQLRTSFLFAQWRVEKAFYRLIEAICKKIGLPF